MGALLGKLIQFFRSTVSVAREGWAHLNETDRGVFAVATGVIMFGLLFSSGLMYAGATFAVSMLISLGLLCYTVPSILHVMIHHRVGVDVCVTLATLIGGFMSGSATITVAMMFFGLAVSAGLRLGKAVEDKIPQGAGSFGPVRWLKAAWNSKPATTTNP